MQTNTKKINKQHIFIALVVVLFLVFGIFYSLETAPWQHPDEFGHFSYIKYLQKHQSLPAYLTPYDFWEAHQPPLYYFLSLPPVLAFSGQSIEFQLYAARIFGLIFAVLNILVLYRIFSLVFEKITNDQIRKNIYTNIATVVAAFWPMYLYISTGLNNDTLANLLGSLVILQILHLPKWFKQSDSPKLARKAMMIGLVISACLLTKTGLYVMAILLFLMALWYLWKYQRQHMVKFGIYLSLTVLSLSGWLFVRNFMVVGDPFGWSNFDLTHQYQQGNLSGFGEIIEWLRLVMKSSFGIFGYFNIFMKPGMLYTAFAWALVISAIGHAVFLLKNKFKGARVLSKVYFILLTVFISVFIYSLKAYQPQGRYLFLALAGIILFLCAGWLINIANKKVLYALLCLVIIGMPGLSLINLDTIVQAEAKMENKSLIPVDLLQQHWYREYARVSTDLALEVTATQKMGSRVLAFGNLRVDTTAASKLVFQAITEDVNSITFTPAYMATTQFLDKYSQTIELVTDGQPHYYSVPIQEAVVGRPDIIIGLEISFAANTHEESTILFPMMIIE